MRNFLVLVLVVEILGPVNADLEKQVQELSSLVNEQRLVMVELSATVLNQQSAIEHLREENEMQRRTVEKVMKALRIGRDLTQNPDDFAQNTTIEERVNLLEVQMVDVQENIGLLFQNDNFLFDEQVIQDERLFALEQSDVQINQILFQLDEDIEDLEDTTLLLDLRVAELEENGGGGGGNSSVTELEERVETLEEAVETHDTDIADLESITGNHETRLTAAEENIQGLLTADVAFDERITALEQGGGGGGNQSNTIAFHAALTEYETIAYQTPVIFDEVFFNEGDGYDPTTGVFTVPSGGDGFYYFSTGLQVVSGELGDFGIYVNGEDLCYARGENDSSEPDTPRPSCSAVVNLVAGDVVEVIYETGTNDTPIYENTSVMWNVFNGFRI